MDQEMITMVDNRNLRAIVHDITGGVFLTKAEYIQICKAEDRYLCLLEWGASPQEARAVLPNSLKTEIVVTANLREWRNIFKLRAVGVTGKPHPQMLEVMVPLLEEVKKQIPVVFDDLVTE